MAQNTGPDENPRLSSDDFKNIAERRITQPISEEEQEKREEIGPEYVDPPTPKTNPNLPPRP